MGCAVHEPDAFIACSAPGRTSIAIAAPIVVCEVLSSGKENRQRDEEEKVDEYGSVPTILRYLLVESETHGVRVVWRNPGERAWRDEPLDKAGPLHLPEFGVILTFDEIYEGIAFD